MEEMLTIARKQASAFRHMSLGTTRRVLWEKSDFRDGRRVSLGLTDNYLKVHTDQDISLNNQITWARLVAESGEGFLAELV
jgi:tRNA A37 methylthiotransferase MiaB